MKLFISEIQKVSLVLFQLMILWILPVSGITSNPHIDSLSKSKTASFYNEDGKLFLPLDQYKVSSVYGYRYHPQTNKRHFHPAIDLHARWGEPVYAAEEGKVVFSGWKSGLGYYIKINHGIDKEGNKIATAYAHLSRLLVDKGDIVLSGQKIAKVGSTGKSTGSHLHFEVHQNNVKKNPAIFFRHHELKEFAKYTVGGGRRMEPVKKIKPIFPVALQLDFTQVLPEWVEKYYTIPEFLYPDFVFKMHTKLELPEKIPAPIPFDKGELRLNQKHISCILQKREVDENEMLPDIKYGLQVCASRVKLDESRIKELNQKYGETIKEDYDGKYFRYTLLASHNKYFSNENEVRSYIRKLNNEEFMGVICYKKGKRMTIGWE